MRRILWTIALVLLLCTAGFAEEITFTYRFTEPQLSADDSGAVEVAISGLHRHLVPGEPILPVAVAWLAIPQNHEVVELAVETGQTAMLAEATPLWAPHFAPFSRPHAGTSARPNSAIYGGTEPFPKNAFAPLSLQFKQGVAIQPIKLYPVRFQPSMRRLSFTPEMTVRLTTRPRRSLQAGILPYRGLPADRRELALRLDNPDMLDCYRSTAPADGAPVDYLAVAPAAFHATLQPYLDHKASLFGLQVELVDYADILASAPGGTDTEKVRNYLIERYADGLRYVLLVGDADYDEPTIPLRPLYVTGVDPDDLQTYTDEQMASDQYYGCLDGSYNENGNSWWGETTDGPAGGDVDLLYDVHVGRFAVSDVNDLQRMIDKTMAFENDLETPWKILFVGEYTDSITWGGDEKDEVYTHCGEMSIPLTTRYERDGQFSMIQLKQAINSNEHQWLNHSGHANVTYNMLFDPYNLWNLQNTRPYLGFSQGCYSGSVDGLDDWGWVSSVDCMAEQFTARITHGAFAYFMNTRYGFYLTGRVDGPSNVYDWELAEAFFNDGIPNIGAAMDHGKESCLGMLSPNNMMRWQWYTLFLFGDPQTPMRLNCDNDNDGDIWTYCGGADCDDQNEAISSLAQEICDDGIDNNCNDLVDFADPACGGGDDDDDDDDDNNNDDDTVPDDDDAVDDDAADDDDAVDDDAADDDDAVDDDNDDLTDDDQADDDVVDDDDLTDDDAPDDDDANAAEDDFEGDSGEACGC